MKLCEAQLNKNYVVKYVNTYYKEKRRLYDLGITPGVKIKKVLISLMGKPSAYEVKNTTISIRDDIASLIEVDYE